MSNKDVVSLLKTKFVPLQDQLDQINLDVGRKLSENVMGINHLILELTTVLSNNRQLASIYSNHPDEDVLLDDQQAIGACWNVSLGYKSLQRELKRQQDQFKSDDFNKLSKDDQLELQTAYGNQTIGTLKVLKMQITSIVLSTVCSVIMLSGLSKTEVKQAIGDSKTLYAGVTSFMKVLANGGKLD